MSIRQIKKIETLLFQGNKEKTSVVSLVENLSFKVTVRKNLIAITNQQANLLTREINNNQKTITKLRDRLTILKEEYASMIVKSYKSKSEQSKVMFLLSSSNFQQAYRRLEYIKQYALYQKKQGEQIKSKTIELQALNQNLLYQKKDKEALIKENKLEKNRLEIEIEEQEALVSSIKNDLRKYTSQIKLKQQEISKIDRQIAKIIRDAMAASNVKAGKSKGSKTFVLTPEDKQLAASFTANKGKLPWPVKYGLVKVRYGIQKSPIDRTVPIKSNGVRIATEKGSKVRAVFDGEVSAVLKMKNVNPIVMVRHGDYLTLYKNLSEVYVKEGDKVSTKQIIGAVFTNPSNGETILSFSLSKGTATENPASWIFKM